MLDSWAKIHRLIRSTHGSSANSKSTLLVAMWHACRSKSQNKGEWWAQAPTSPVLAMLKGHFRYCTAGDMLMLETCRSEIKQINKLQLFPWLSVRFLCLKMLMHWSPVPSPCCPNSNEINPNVDFSMSSTTWLMALDGGSNQLAAHVFLLFVLVFFLLFFSGVAQKSQDIKRCILPYQKGFPTKTKSYHVWKGWRLSPGCMANILCAELVLPTLTLDTVQSYPMSNFHPSTVGHIHLVFTMLSQDDENFQSQTSSDDALFCAGWSGTSFLTKHIQEKYGSTS